jgi:hypothetical protein
MTGPKWNGVSQLRADIPVERLRAIAEDKSAERRTRAKAVFSLFANYLWPPKDSSNVGAVLGTAPWLTESRLDPIQGVGGLVPLETIFDGTAFVLRLFSDKNGWSDWVIYLRLSGADAQSAVDGKSFLSGSATKPRSSMLMEFALCFPPQGKGLERRVERFTAKGISTFSP